MRKIYKFLTLSLFFTGSFTSFGQTCSIDQSFLGGDTRPSTIGSNTALPDGQSFRAGISGALYSVTLDLSANNPGCSLSSIGVKMDILNGSGIAGTVLASQTFTLPTTFSRSLQTFNFSSPALVTATQMYTIIFTLLPSQDCGSGEPQLIWYYQFPTGFWSATGGTQFENGVITSLGNTQYFRTCVGPACYISDQTVNTPSPDVICGEGSSTISTGNSQTGVFYFLRNDANNAIVDGPVSGDGSGIAFNTGTINTTTTYNVYAIKDYGVNLPLSYDHVRYSSPYYAYTNEITVESWVYSPSGSFPWAGQSSDAIDNMSTNVWLWHAGSFLVNNNGSWINLNFPPLSADWTHIATVADASGMYIYYNGVLVASSSTGVTSGIRQNSSSVVDLGHDSRFPSGTPGRNSNTGFDNFRIWNVARTNGEISSNMNNCSISNFNLVLSTNFKEGTGINIVSAIGSNAEIMNPSANNWIMGSLACLECDLELSQTATVTVNALPEIVSESGDLSVCGNLDGVFGLIANNTDTYSWEYSYNGGSPTTITGSYGETGYNSAMLQIPSLLSGGWDGYDVACVLTSADGCSITSSLMHITANPAPDANVTDNSPTLTADQSGADYQWIDCNNGNAPIAGETNQSFTATVNGNYAVIVTLNGCSETSACFPVTVTGINLNNSSATVNIYPNPASDKVAMQFDRKGSFEIYSVDGKLIEASSTVLSSTIVNVNNYASGMYMIKFRDEKGNVTHAKFVKE